jgi:hypothetical protein
MQAGLFALGKRQIKPKVEDLTVVDAYGYIPQIKIIFL